MHDDGLCTMSADTSGSSLYSSTPRYEESPEAFANAAFTSSIDASVFSVATRSVMEPIGHRDAERRAVELALEVREHRADRPGRARACSG